jgi:hypothetical protein
VLFAAVVAGLKFMRLLATLKTPVNPLWPAAASFPRSDSGATLTDTWTAGGGAVSADEAPAQDDSGLTSRKVDGNSTIEGCTAKINFIRWSYGRKERLDRHEMEAIALRNWQARFKE